MCGTPPCEASRSSRVGRQPGARDDALGESLRRRIDHFAVERARSVRSGEDTARPLDLLGRGREHVVHDLELPRVDAPLAVVAEREGRSAEARSPASSSSTAYGPSIGWTPAARAATAIRASAYSD